MKRFEKSLLVLAAFLFMIKGAQCQAVTPPPGETVHDEVFLSIGLEPEVVSTIGYTHLIAASGKNVDWNVGASLKFAPLIVSHGAWRADLIGPVDWGIGDHWGTRIIPSIYLAHDHNGEGAMNGLGFELRSATVHFGRKWDSGFELGWQYTAFVHIKNSEEAKDAFHDRYPGNAPEIQGPKDGWYGAAASRFRLGFVTATKLNDRLRLQLGIGSLVNIQKQGVMLGFSHAQVPAYFESVLSYHW